MTDITALIGPLPEPTPAPKFPTPWRATADIVEDANGNLVFHLPFDVKYTISSAPDEVREEVVRFIADAVNEKIARDSGAVIITDNDGDEWHELEPGRFWANSASPGDSAVDYRREGPGEWVSRESIEDIFGIRSERAL